jgi:hypothetical protein
MSSLLTQTVKNNCSPWCTLRHSGQNRDRFVEQCSRPSIRPIPSRSGHLLQFLALDLHHVHHLYLRATYLVEGQSICTMCSPLRELN